MNALLERLGRFASRRHWWVIGVWLVLLVGLGVTADRVGGSYVNDYTVPGSESSRGLDKLEADFTSASGYSGQIVFHATSGRVTDHKKSEVGRAAAVLPSSNGVSQTLSVDRIDDGFVAVSKRGGDVADFVWTWTAPNAWGPWTAHEEVEAPAGFDTGDLQYAPLAHPEVPLASGKLLASVSRNTTDAARLVEDPSLGRPLFVEVTRP